MSSPCPRDMAEGDDDEAVVSMQDVIEQMHEEEAVVMGGIDNEDVCSFTKGYMRRQAVYTCRTCLDVSKVKAGFCYRCSLSCHEGHDLIELYTKRNFRCDCGNAKFGGIKCLLWEEKDDENVHNQYNDNFADQYCVCKRPYPDEDYEGNEEMIQCGICEDWFHVEHLNVGTDFKVPDNYEELTCFLCVKKYPFLAVYGITQNEEPVFRLSKFASSDKCTTDVEHKSEHGKLDTPGSPCQCKLAMAVNNLGLVGTNLHDLNCDQLFPIDSLNIPPIFWSSGWREKLCRCCVCKGMYKAQNLEFLLDPQDSMTYYLSLGKQRAMEIDQEQQTALSEVLAEMPHAVSSNFAAGVDYFRNALQEFLRKKGEHGHVITEAEIKVFFEEIQEKLRHW
ncbi:unnamed protein product [Calicophoron daubneyi]|uniref:UBR-type domain-containing protein n=1 Tax=Calicophoron daubneyi TaxID=300641 RepID=A0AAV2U1J5_CALDB